MHDSSLMQGGNGQAAGNRQAARDGGSVGSGQQPPPPRRPYGDVASTTAPAPPLSRQERILRIALFAGAALFAVEAAIYVPDVVGGPADSRPFAINSVAKDVLFAALIALAAVDLRRLSRLIGLVILGHVVILVLLVTSLLTGNTETVFPPPRWLVDLLPFLDVAPELRLVVWFVACLGATAALVWLYGRALKVRYDLRYLFAPEHETVSALADAILDHPAVPPREIATAVDHYWDSLDVEHKIRLKGALWLVCLSPLRWGRPPLPLMERGRRREFLERHLLPGLATREPDGKGRMMLQSAIRFAMQMVYSAYYNDTRSYAAVGYERFSKRPHYPGRPPRHRPLRTIEPCTVTGSRKEDVVVIGSGAGGAMVARELVRRGRRVLILERGHHLERSEFVEDEALMYSRLYSDGALQTSNDFTFQVLQGMCVGGTTVVNNGVSFNLPPDVLKVWNDQHETGLPPDELAESFDVVREVVGVSEQNIERPNPIVNRLAGGNGGGEGSEGSGGPEAGGGSSNGDFHPVYANMDECLGCGYCNIGCRFGRKLSMLDGVLPDTQNWADDERDENPEFPGKLEILPECRVTEILERGKRATGVRCKLRMRDGSTRKIEIEAETVVVAAGAIHSSRLLMQSGIGGPLVGTGLSANLGAHMTADFGDDGPPLRAFDGLQMSHYLDDGRAREHMIETWFNPVMSQALVMPGWVGHHQRNMERYDRLGALGILVGSEPNSHKVLPRRQFLNGAEVDFTPSETDLRRILKGLRETGEILLDRGAKHVMPLTFHYHELRTKEDLAKLEYGNLVKDASDISVNTGHPQGGNAMSSNPKKGVVDERFRVHGYENLYVCDASVFPSAVRVNPQLTVMALAHRAGSQCIPSPGDA